MKVTIDLDKVDIQNLIRRKVYEEAAKHGHPNPDRLHLMVEVGNAELIRLEDLNVAVKAEVEVGN